MLIREMREDRKSRSRSTRGRSPTSRDILSPQRIAEPEHQVDDAQSMTGATPVGEQDPADGIIQQLTESGELKVLTRLQRLEITCRTGGTDQLIAKKGQRRRPS
jgi:hypothetical protein